MDAGLSNPVNSREDWSSGQSRKDIIQNIVSLHE